MTEKISEASNKKQKDWKRTYYCNAGKRYFLWLFFSVGDPDPHVFGPSGFDRQRYGSGSFPLL